MKEKATMMANVTANIFDYNVQAGADGALEVLVNVRNNNPPNVDQHDTTNKGLVLLLRLYDDEQLDQLGQRWRKGTELWSRYLPNIHPGSNGNAKETSCCFHLQDHVPTI